MIEPRYADPSDGYFCTVPSHCTQFVIFILVDMAIVQ